MNVNKFFEVAKNKGVTESEIKTSRSYSLSVSLFRSEISNYTLSDITSINARGIYNGQMSSVMCELDDKTTPAYLVEKIVTNASLLEKDVVAPIFKGSKKYFKKKIDSSKVFELPLDKKIENLYEIERKLKEYDSRIVEIEHLVYEEEASEYKLNNSHGLKLGQKAGYFVYYAYVKVKENDEVKTGGDVFVSSNTDEFNIDLFVEEVAKDALSKLGGTQCASKKYNVVLNNDVTASLLRAYLSNMSAEQVQKGSSLFIGKLNQQIANKKLTVSEMPLLKTPFFKYFDAEGVACTNKKIVDKGVLTTYAHNIETATKDGVESTGNASGSTGSGISLSTLVVKPGKLTEEELFAKVGNGIYITSLEGLHSGLNAQSGHFSLKCEGFMIVDGKIDHPLSLITIAGNLKDIFENIAAIGSNAKLRLSNAITPSIMVKKVAISGK